MVMLSLFMCRFSATLNTKLDAENTGASLRALRGKNKNISILLGYQIKHIPKKILLIA